MDESRIAIIDLADELQVRKQRLFKVIGRMGLRTVQRREVSRGNQLVVTITLAEADAVRLELTASQQRKDVGAEFGEADRVDLIDGVGVFYLIQLERDHDPGRFKVGFTSELEGRLRKHRCSAPFAECIKSWPARRTWERAAIDCVTNGCEQLHTEVFRAVSLSDVAARADAFFSMMPKPSATAASDDDEVGAPGA